MQDHYYEYELSLNIDYFSISLSFFSFSFFFLINASPSVYIATFSVSFLNPFGLYSFFFSLSLRPMVSLMKQLAKIVLHKLKNENITNVHVEPIKFYIKNGVSNTNSSWNENMPILQMPRVASMPTSNM